MSSQRAHAINSRIGNVVLQCHPFIDSSVKTFANKQPSPPQTVVPAAADIFPSSQESLATAALRLHLKIPPSYASPVSLLFHCFTPSSKSPTLSINMAATKIPVPKPGEGEPIVFFDIQLGGMCFLLPA